MLPDAVGSSWCSFMFSRSVTSMYPDASLPVNYCKKPKERRDHRVTHIELWCCFPDVNFNPYCGGESSGRCWPANVVGVDVSQLQWWIMDQEAGQSCIASLFLSGWHLHTPNTWFQIEGDIDIPSNVYALDVLNKLLEMFPEKSSYRTWKKSRSVGVESPSRRLERQGGGVTKLQTIHCNTSTSQMDSPSSCATSGFLLL